MDQEGLNAKLFRGSFADLLWLTVLFLDHIEMGPEKSLRIPVQQVLRVHLAEGVHHSMHSKPLRDFLDEVVADTCNARHRDEV